MVRWNTGTTKEILREKERPMGQMKSRSLTPGTHGTLYKNKLGLSCAKLRRS